MSFYKIRTYIRQNSKRLQLIAIGVVLFFIILQVLNQVAKLSEVEKKEETKKDLEQSMQKQQELQENPSMETVISGENVSKEKNDRNINIINEFCENCNNGNIEDAYNMLSSRCKEILFPSLEDFENKYYSLIFTEKRSFKTQSWIQSGGINTYKITIGSDLLSTGGKSNSETVDYYTIVKENEEEKLNINGYVKKEEIEGTSNIRKFRN